MKTKKAGKVPHLILETVRLTAIKLGVLPRNFPKFEKIHLHSVHDKKLDYGGYGGYVELNGDFVPFICVNLHYIYDSTYMTAVIAHEILHINQVRKNQDASHNNAFRKDCKILAKALGINYYLIFGYDVPHEKTCIYAGKKAENWMRSFRIEKEKRIARGYSDTIE